MVKGESEKPNFPLPRYETTTRFPSWRISTSARRRSSPSTVMFDSSPSVVSTSMPPEGMPTSRSRGNGVWKVRSSISVNHPDQPLDAEPDLAVARGWAPVGPEGAVAECEDVVVVGEHDLSPFSC